MAQQSFICVNILAIAISLLMASTAANADDGVGLVQPTALNQEESSTGGDLQCNPRLQARVIGDKCGSCCRRMYQPVCGSDGETYDNDCHLGVAICRSYGKIYKIRDGECYQEEEN